MVTSKRWKNCNPTSSGARNAALRRCGVTQGVTNGFEEVDQSPRIRIWSTSSKPGSVAISNPTPSMDFVPHPSRCGVTIFPPLRGSASKISCLCYGSLGLWSTPFASDRKAKLFKWFPWFENIVYGLMYMYGCQWLSWLEGMDMCLFVGYFFVAGRTFFGVRMLYSQKIVSWC